MSGDGRILRVFPRRTSDTPTDAYAVVGEPSLWIPENIREVHVSVTFTWDVNEGKRLVEAWASDPRITAPVRIGGPAIAPPRDGFTPGRYVREGITYTSRGCNNRCPWCFVPEREGPVRPCRTVEEGWIVQDNNFLQTPQAHRRRVYDMLRAQGRVVQFRGGLEAARLTTWDEDQIRGLRLGKNSLWFACDEPVAMKPLKKVLARFHDLPIRFKRVYVLAGFASPAALDARCREIMAAGAIPFAQLYRGPDEKRRRRWPDDWAPTVRRWSRPALSLAVMRGAEA